MRMMRGDNFGICKKIGTYGVAWLTGRLARSERRRHGKNGGWVVEPGGGFKKRVYSVSKNYMIDRQTTGMGVRNEASGN